MQTWRQNWQIKEDKDNRSMEVEKAIMTNKAIIKINFLNLVMTWSVFNVKKKKKFKKDCPIWKRVCEEEVVHAKPKVGVNVAPIV